MQATDSSTTQGAGRRRELVFSGLDDILAEVERLRAGCRMVGRWSLGQICRHLADSFDGSVNGFGVRRHWLMRTVFGRVAIRRVFATGRIDAGFTVTERLNPPESAPLDESVARLAAALDRYRSHDGSMGIHPFFGRLSRAEWDRLHVIHSAHHLSFAIPVA
jgi:hypothetical protein